jgi:hypothetical protein
MRPTATVFSGPFQMTGYVDDYCADAREKMPERVLFMKDFINIQNH